MALNVEELEETIALYHMSNYSLKQFNLQNYSVPIEAYGKQGIGKTSAALGALSRIENKLKVLDNTKEYHIHLEKIHVSGLSKIALEGIPEDTYELVNSEGTSIWAIDSLISRYENDNYSLTGRRSTTYSTPSFVENIYKQENLAKLSNKEFHCILMLDDYTRGEDDIYNVLMPLLESKDNNNFNLSNLNLTIYLNSNPSTEDFADVRSVQDKAQEDRKRSYELVFDPIIWAKHLYSISYIEPSLVTWAVLDRAFIFNNERSGRTLHRLFMSISPFAKAFLKSNSQDEKEKVKEDMSVFFKADGLGVSLLGKYLQYLSSEEAHLPSPEDIFNKPNEAIADFTKKISALYSSDKSKAKTLVMLFCLRLTTLLKEKVFKLDKDKKDILIKLMVSTYGKDSDRLIFTSEYQTVVKLTLVSIDPTFTARLIRDINNVNNKAKKTFSIPGR